MASATEEKSRESKASRDRALDEAPDDDLILNTLEWDYGRSFQRGRSASFEVEASGYYAIWVAGASVPM